MVRAHHSTRFYVPPCAWAKLSAIANSLHSRAASILTILTTTCWMQSRARYTECTLMLICSGAHRKRHRGERPGGLWQATRRVLYPVTLGKQACSHSHVGRDDRSPRLAALRRWGQTRHRALQQLRSGLGSYRTRDPAVGRPSLRSRARTTLVAPWRAAAMGALTSELQHSSLVDVVNPAAWRTV